MTTQTTEPSLEARNAIAELRSLGWTVEPPMGNGKYGCHLDLFALPKGAEPDGCVLDDGDRHSCIYTKDISCKEQCPYWRRITPISIREARHGI